MSRPDGGQFLRAETEFADFAGDGIGLEFGVVGVNDRLLAVQQRGVLNAAAGDLHQADGAVLIAHRENALGAFGHKINFAGGQVGDVRFFAAAKAVALLRLLAVA